MTKQTEIKVAVAETDIKYLKDSLDELHIKVDLQNGKVATNNGKINWIIGAGSGSIAILGALQYFQ